MKLMVDDSVWEPEEILLLAQRALQIPEERPEGDGTLEKPFRMDSVRKWHTAATQSPQGVKRAFYNVGGRLLHRRLNRTQSKYSDYITECGPCNITTINAISLARNNRDSNGLKRNIQPNAEQFQTERFDTPARWYTRAGSMLEEDSDLKGLGGIGPTYNSIQDAIGVLLKGDLKDVTLAQQMRECLQGNETGAPASIACLTAAWFLGEVNRHPRSLLSALILLDMIEGRHSAHSSDLLHAEVFTFEKVVSKQSSLPHPMSGKGTVDKAAAAQARTEDLKTRSEANVSVKWKRPGKSLNVVEARESEILTRWLARRLNKSNCKASFLPDDNKEVVRIEKDDVKNQLEGLITAHLHQRLETLVYMG